MSGGLPRVGGQRSLAYIFIMIGALLNNKGNKYFKLNVLSFVYFSTLKQFVGTKIPIQD